MRSRARGSAARSATATSTPRRRRFRKQRSSREAAFARPVTLTRRAHTPSSRWTHLRTSGAGTLGPALVRRRLPEIGGPPRCIPFKRSESRSGTIRMHTQSIHRGVATASAHPLRNRRTQNNRDHARRDTTFQLHSFREFTLHGLNVMSVNLLSMQNLFFTAGFPNYNRFCHSAPHLANMAFSTAWPALTRICKLDNCLPGRWAGSVSTPRKGVACISNVYQLRSTQQPVYDCFRRTGRCPRR
jgi:hypothetical protein